MEQKEHGNVEVNGNSEIFQDTLVEELFVDNEIIIDTNTLSDEFNQDQLFLFGDIHGIFKCVRFHQKNKYSN